MKVASFYVALSMIPISYTLSLMAANPGIWVLPPYRRPCKTKAILNNERYQTCKFLGRGTYGQVHMAKDVKNNVLVAVKEPVEDYEGKIRAEANLHLKLPILRNVVHLLDVVETPRIHLVMELAPFGSMDDNFFINKKAFSQSIKEGNGNWKRVIKEMVQAVSQLHHAQVCHRDVAVSFDLNQTRNFLVFQDIKGTLFEDPVVKIADFGTSRSLNQDCILGDIESLESAIHEMLDYYIYLNEGSISIQDVSMDLYDLLSRMREFQFDSVDEIFEHRFFTFARK